MNLILHFCYHVKFSLVFSPHLIFGKKNSYEYNSTENKDIGSHIMSMIDDINRLKNYDTNTLIFLAVFHCGHIGSNVIMTSENIKVFYHKTFKS